MMGPFDSRDTVDLHEADVMDELQQAGLCEGAAGRQAQTLLGEEDTAGIGIREQIRHVQNVGFYSQVFKSVATLFFPGLSGL
jgi:hypothetical protein